ncbi:MAG: cation diffusion facilitator family transporter [Campylobacterota bacterium]
MSGHHHHHEVKGGRLFITIILNIIITLAQIIGGIYSGSLALLSDALHNFSDVITLIVTYVTNRMARRSPTRTKTFGYKRAEILAAFFDAAVLIGIGFFLIVEAVERFFTPEPVGSLIVIGLALLSIVLNAASVLLIKEDSEHNINVRSAYLHLLTDVMTSVAVLIGGLAMYYYELFWIDPLVSMLIAFYLIYAAFAILKESTGILMQFSPPHIDLESIENLARGHAELSNIHHIHIWQLNDHEVFFEAHLDFRENLPLEEVTRVCETIEEKIKNNYAITHVTLQSEYLKEDDKALVYGA